jgi:predicted DNA-binding transcriptional regulator AlpA
MRRVKLTDPLELIRKRELAKILGVHVWTIDYWRRLGRIPPPIILSQQVVAWRRTDIEAWLDDKRVAPNAENSDAA